MPSAIEVHIAALRSVLKGEEAYELARWLSADEDIMCSRKPDVVMRLGYDWYKMSAADRYELAAACLILAAEYASLTPFDRWLRTKGNVNISAGTLAMMRDAFEAGSNG